VVLFVLALSACSGGVQPAPEDPAALQETPTLQETATPTSTPEPRILSVCLGQEPASLFLYGDNSPAARSIRSAIYDGPIDRVDFQLQPVLLEEIPSLANGGATVESAQARPGDWIIDANGELASLAEGVAYLPAGCQDASCALAYTGRDPVAMDQLVVRFKLRPGLLWSDGAPLTADDSLYSYEVARALYPQARPGVLDRTAAYTAVDPATVEWRGIPGLLDPAYQENFFAPLPRHAWGEFPTAELAENEAASRSPLGWGAYVMDGWTAGDRITLSPNPNYFRFAEGLPKFDQLVFRFMPGAEQAVQALVNGECDILDESLALESQLTQVQELQAAGKATLLEETGAAWEHADFGIASYPPDPARPSLFQQKTVRQAIAQCIDRSQMGATIPDSYSPPGNPLTSSSVRQYPYDPQAAAALLDSAGWPDADGNPGTPRTSLAVPGVPDGTPLAFTYLVSQDSQQGAVAEIIRQSLAGCGISMEISTLPAGDLFAPGPDGPLFGRQFAMAQYAWPAAIEPPCYLYTTRQIPGPYPEYSLGWGGANATGFSSAELDQACRQALNSLPDQPAHANAHFQAQAVFLEELPSLPLFLRSTYLASRPDLCGLAADASATNALWNLEMLDYGDGCQK
jgi:peptide/nickel transport system substrate-binding protein